MGNLTLVTPGFNSSLSNEAFSTKRPEIAANSSLVLNSYFQALPSDAVWDEEAILTRAGALFGMASKVWPCPVATAPAAGKAAA
jgi:hypothetical protein